MQELQSNNTSNATSIEMPVWLVMSLKSVETVAIIGALVMLVVIVRVYRKTYIKKLSMIVLYFFIALALFTNLLDLWVDPTIESFTLI